MFGPLLILLGRADQKQDLRKLAGLERVNLFIAELEKLNIYNDDDGIAFHVGHTDSITNESAAIVSLAPASPPSRCKLLIKRKSDDDPVFLDLLSPFVEPLHYLLLLPHGIPAPSFDFTVHREQGPLALFYATTFNGCQGLTVQKLNLDL
ncbi:hypothetical protein B0H13DRAFT_1856342 [Mycena leptocephala]|nr:hypothetical protein B0H13DRAFT_1856342 [Mycena leptocephala]